MKRLLPIFAVILACASAACAETPATLTSLQAVHALTNAEASRKIPVAFEATVSYVRSYEGLLFVQDGDAAIFVRPAAPTHLVAGDRILVRGTTLESFRPIVIAERIFLLDHGDLPKPVSANFSELIRAERDCMLVTMHGFIRAADMSMSFMAPVRQTRLQVLTDGGPIEADIDSDDPNAIKDLLDAEVEVTGVSAGKFDDKMQQTGSGLYVSSLANVKILHRAATNPWSLPATPMDRILDVYDVRDLTPRVRVEGTITYYEPGSALVLQDGPKSLWIETNTREPLHIGDQAVATGFPESHNRFLSLTDGEVHDSHIFKPISPALTSWHQLGFWSRNAPDGHQNDLVSIEGQLVTQVREASQDELVLMADGRLFTAIYRHPPTTGALPATVTIPPGSKVRVTGICTVVQANTIEPGQEVPFNILLRSFDDVSVVARPSPLNVHNLTLLVGLLLAAMLAVGVRYWVIERKVRRQTASLAYTERRRSRILENINGSRPLAEILEDITELVSFNLRGAPCWCQIADGARLGNYPPKLTELRVAKNQIPSHTGPPLGTVFAAFDLRSKPQSNEAETLAMATGLAALAIETRRLYTDLLHRSEYDLLTDIHNRFSLDKHLDALIDEARESAGVFGLIYIDLDDFKQVNDRYGHQVGDLYLQEVAVRMKRQLRSADLLARLGGDEFAVLLPQIHNRAQVEEIAVRLHRSLDEPFPTDGCVIHGSASVGIALYPEDAITKEGLLSAADAAMYVAKNIRHELRQSPHVA